MRRLLLLLLRGYKRFLSPLLPPMCRFEPTCSVYMMQAVEKYGAKTVVIDSLNGYLNAMPEERFLTLHLHEMLTYLGDHGVATILVMAQHGLIGSNMVSAVDVSYLADCVVLLRYYEAEGELHKAISVMKKRSGDHEKAIREFRMGEGGLNVGPPLTHFRGIFTGIPIIDDK